jgi:hypothetical protein
VLAVLVATANGQPSIDGESSFDGVDTSETESGTFPLDPDLAAGHDIVIQVVNRRVRAWLFDDVEGKWIVVGDADLSAFIGIFGTPSATDPRIVFDADSDRFFVTVYGLGVQGATRSIVVGVSDPESDIVTEIDNDGDPFDASLWTVIDLQGFFPMDADPPINPVAGECATDNHPAMGALVADQPALGSYVGGVLLSAYLGGEDTRDNVFYFVSHEPDQQGVFAVAGPAFGSDFILPAGTLGCAPGQGFGHEKAMPIKGDPDYDHALFVGVDWTPQTETCENAGTLDSFILYSFMDPFNDLSDRRIARVTVSCFGSPDCVETEGARGVLTLRRSCRSPPTTQGSPPPRSPSRVNASSCGSRSRSAPGPTTSRSAAGTRST